MCQGDGPPAGPRLSLVVVRGLESAFLSLSVSDEAVGIQTIYCGGVPPKSAGEGGRFFSHEPFYQVLQSCTSSL